MADLYKPEFNLLADAYLGNKEHLTRKLEFLSKLAQPERWGFDISDPYSILYNYINYTYDRLKQEDKIAISGDAKSMCFNTGLQTRTYEDDIYAYFIENKDTTKTKWFFIAFCIKTDTRMQEFNALPDIANYFTNPDDFIFNRNLDIQLDYEHIIDDNYDRFLEAGFADKHIIRSLLENAVMTVKKKLKRNYKIAIPQFYTDKFSGMSKVQLLLPLFLRGITNKADLALVVDKSQFNYIGKTILTLDWAYINSRRIVKPDVEWLVV